MDQGLLERRRLLDQNSSTEAPPTPVLLVYPSKGNTLTASKTIGNGSSVSDTVTITNSNHSWWDDGVSLSDLVGMAKRDTVFITENSQQNMVWCFIFVPYCVGADVYVDVDYVLTDGTKYTESLSGTTTPTSMVSPSVDDAFDNVLSGIVSPNYGHPWLEKYRDTDHITVRAHSSKDGKWSPETSFTIYHGSVTNIKEPYFTPGGGTYTGSQHVLITQDSTVNGLVTYYKISSSSATDPSPVDGAKYVGNPVLIKGTSYLNAKSFLNLSNGTVISSPTRSELYTITNGGTGLNPPSLYPAPGTFNESPVEITIDNPNNSGSIYYTTDGNTPSNQYGTLYNGPFYISETTTIRSVVYDSTTGITSQEASGTYTITAQYNTNNAVVQYNSDGMSSCGLFSFSKKSDSGNDSDNYGFRITGENRSTQIYFTIDGSSPTTNSTHLSNGEWWSLTEPNTLNIRWLATAPNCPDLNGEFWIRVNKAVAQFTYSSSGRPFILGTTEFNWYSPTVGAYSPTNAVYVYLNGQQIDPVNLTMASATVAGEMVSLVLYEPPTGTQIDTRFSFIYAWSAPQYGDGSQYCPFNMIKDVSGSVSTIYTDLNSNVFSNRIGAETIYVSSNEIQTLRVSGQMRLSELSFAGKVDPYVKPCIEKVVLDYACITITNLTHLDLTPCTNMFQIAESSMSYTYNNNAEQTGLVSVQMPWHVSSLGDSLFVRSPQQTRRPLEVTFYNSTVPSATYKTFVDRYTASSSPVLIDSNSKIVVCDAPYGADVCDYENAWKYHVPRSGNQTNGINHTDMTIVDQDDWECGHVPGSLATVVTGTSGSITQTSVEISANSVTSDGGSTVTSRGVCFGTTLPPYGGIVESGSGTGTFTVQKTGLQPGTTYYYRAFADNAHGRAYGSTESFTTVEQVNTPTVITGGTSNISATGFNIDWCKISDNGGSTVTEKGTCVSTTNPPTYADGHQASSDPASGFGGSWSNLLPSTKYFYCAYAVNSVGIGYGEVKSVKTKPNQTVYPDIRMVSAVPFGDNTYTNVQFECELVDCGTYAPVAIDFLYGTDPYPTPENSTIVRVISNTSTPMKYYYGVTGLNASTTYYVRARAAQQANNHWSYSSNIVQFTTSAPQATFVTGSATEISDTSAKLNAHGNVTTSAPYYGIVYSVDMYPIPTVSDGLESGKIVWELMEENQTTYKDYSPEISNLQQNTSYQFRSFVCSDIADGGSDAIYGSVKEFTTTDVGNYIHVKSGTTHTNGNYRRCASVNVSFRRYLWTSIFGIHKIYSWGMLHETLYGTAGPILSHPWSYIGDEYTSNVPVIIADRGNLDSTPTHIRDLFGWGATSQPHRSEYQAWYDGAYSSDYYAYGVSGSDLTGIYGGSSEGEANWGYQNYRERLGTGGIFDGSLVVTDGNNGVCEAYETSPEDMVNGVQYQDYSRPLTSTEMNYVLNTRTTSSNSRFCKARIDHVNTSPRYTNGLVIFCDNWNNPISVNQVNVASADYSSNNITESVWNTYFKDKAVFLPAAGYAMPTSSGVASAGINEVGCYWLNDSYSADKAYYLKFGPSTLAIDTDYKSIRFSVRLWVAEQV